jgi:hypothetical protein
MTKAKVTKRDIFSATIGILQEVAERDGMDVSILIEGLEREIELLNKKRAGGSVDNAKAIEQEQYMTLIAATMEGREEMRAGEISKATDMSVQRVSAMLRKMVDAGRVVRDQRGKEVFFTLS